MQVVFSALARQELDDASDYYQMALEGLGKLFRHEVRIAVKRIMAHPKAWSVGNNEIRKCLMHRFPYNIFYSIEPDHIFIIAIAHQHRKPDYWVGKK